MNFTIRDIKVDFDSTFGKDFLLVDVVAKPLYKDGTRTDEIVYNYVICCYERKMKQINVKIPGKQILSVPDGEAIAVELVEPEAKVYFMNGQVGFTISATAIREKK